MHKFQNIFAILKTTVAFAISDDIDYSDCISKKVLNQLSSDVSKLKAKGCIDTVNKNKLTLLINLAMRNVDLVKNLSAGPVSLPHFHSFDCK